MEEGGFPAARRGEVEEPAEHADVLGHDIHIQSDYGDEAGWRMPWDLFDEDDAQEALSLAEKAVRLGARIVGSAG